jgi:chromosome segregation ATPase
MNDKVDQVNHRVDQVNESVNKKLRTQVSEAKKNHERLGKELRAEVEANLRNIQKEISNLKGGVTEENLNLFQEQVKWLAGTACRN